MVEFKRKKTITNDTMVSKYFVDMYDGGTTTAHLLGGLKANKYLFQADVASKPTFGNSELKRLEFDFYVNDISIGENTTKYPNVVSYLLKPGIDITEGRASRLDSDILAFSSVQDGYASIADVFDGNGDAGGDAAVYSNIARTIIKESKLYTSVNNAYDHGQKGYKWRNGKDNHSKDSIRTDFGQTAAQLGIEGGDDSTNFIEVQTSYKESNYYSSDNLDQWHKCSPNASHTGIGHEIWIQAKYTSSKDATMSTTEGYGTEANPSNTIFEIVRGSSEYSLWDTVEKTSRMLGVAIPRFNTTDFVKGGQSLEMFAFWTGVSNDKDDFSYQNKTYTNNSSQTTGGPVDRQECLLVKKNIPYPVPKAAQPSKERDNVHRMGYASHTNDLIYAEGHGLSNGMIIHVEPGTFGDIVGTNGDDVDWEARNLNNSGADRLGRGAYVREATADTFRVSGANNSSADDIFDLGLNSGASGTFKFKVVDEGNDIKATSSSHVQLKDSAFADYDEAEHCSRIEIDINIKKLAKAYAYQTENSSGSDSNILYADDDTVTAIYKENDQIFLTLRRGFHIVFGTEPPAENDTLYDYIARMSHLQDRGGSPRYRVQAPGHLGLNSAEDKETYWALQSSKSFDKSTTQNACFAGVSVLNTTAGIQVIPFNGVGGLSDTSPDGTTGLYLSDHDMRTNSTVASALDCQGDLMFREDTGGASSQINNGATGKNVPVSIENQWTRFTFAVDPATSISDRDSRGMFSFGRLFISNLSDGKIIKVGSEANEEGRDFLDLALYGDGGDATTAGIAASPFFYSYNSSEGAVEAPNFINGKKYKITKVNGSSNDWTGWGGLNPAVVGQIFVATGAGLTTNNQAVSLTQDPSNWPKHMSIWLTNAKPSTDTSSNVGRDVNLPADTDAQSVVLLDAIRFKDFNYEITNSSQLDAMRMTSPIKIENGKGFTAPSGDYYGTDEIYLPGKGTGGEFLAGRFTPTPSLLTLGFTSRDYLSVNSSSAADGYNSWTDWPYGFWLNDFRASNLGTVGNIPDYNIKATVSMARYSTGTTDTIPLGHQFSQKGIDFQVWNNDYNAGTIVPHNLYTAYDDGDQYGRMAISTQWLNTGLTIYSNDVSNGDGDSEFTCAQNTSFGTSTPCPIRVGDKVRLQENNQYRGGSIAKVYEYTVDGVSGATNGASGGGSLVFTVEETATTAGDGGEGNADNWAASGDGGPASTGHGGYLVAINTPALCKNFSQKGGFQMYANSHEEFCATKRENVAASARLLEINELTPRGTVLTVDTMAPFDNDDDEEYVFYLYGEEATFSDSHNAIPDTIASNSANCKTGLKLISKNPDKNTITVAWDGKDNAGTTILSYDNIHRLYVSPWRYWAHIMINVSDSDGLELSPRTYGNIQLYNNNWTDKDSIKRSWFGEGMSFTTTDDVVDTAFSNRSGIGTTWREFLFNDTPTGGVNGAYVNIWDLDKKPKHSQIECDTDFGFGAYDEETLEGGFTGKSLLLTSRYNTIRMNKVVESADLEPTDTVNFLVDYLDEGLSHKTTLSTSSHATYPPYLFSVFEDEMPETPKLSVAPYKEDPFLPEFTWEASDSDLWYGIIHVDSKSIDSQYHNAIWHVPLNPSGDHRVATTDKIGNELYFNDNTVGASDKTALFTETGALIDAEGLAGNCVRFDGVDDNISYNATSGLTFVDLNTSSAASIVVHITPDNGIDGTQNWIFKGYPFYINYDATNGVIQGRCYTSATAYVALAGPDIITDGQTPTCVIVTIDNELKAGNCKLYINGALVDQSGKISSSAPATDGTGFSWHNNSGSPVVPYTATTTAATIGAAANSFLGRIEEVVLYKSCIYPVVPSVGNFILDKSLKEIQNGTPISNNVRLFVKDYHNIRGSTTDDVSASSSVSFRKAAFRLVD